MFTRPIQSLIKYAKYVPQVSTSQKIGGLRFYNQRSVVENELIIGGLVVAGGAVTLQYALAAYKQYQANKAANPKPVEEAEEAKSKKETSTKAKQSATGSATGAKSSANAKPSPFATWFARNFYDGGFEEKMTRREAALILGIRESASPEKIKEAHRRILLLNHPDRGGSAHIAAKINEAKDLLMKGK